jgi:hypothetical protein
VTFTIRRAFLWPLALLLTLLAVLFVVSVAQRQPPVKLVLLAVIMLLLGGLLVVSWFRRLTIEQDRVRQRLPGRGKSLLFAELTAVETIMVRKRVFLTLCAGEEFIILSNAYGRFTELVACLLERVPADIVSGETARMAKAPPMRNSDILSCWLAIVLILVIICHQLSLF